MSTYIGTVIVARVDGCVEELGEMADGQTAVTRSGRRRAALDVLEDGLSVGLRDQGRPVVIIPSPLLLDAHLVSFQMSESI